MYKDVLNDSFKFSSTIDSNLASKYIKWKCKLDSNLKDKQIILEGTALQYLSILSQLFINYTGYDKFFFTKWQKNFHHYKLRFGKVGNFAKNFWNTGFPLTIKNFKIFN